MREREREIEAEKRRDEVLHVLIGSGGKRSAPSKQDCYRFLLSQFKEYNCTDLFD